MANKLITITKTNSGGDSDNFDVFCTSESPDVLLASGVSRVDLEAGVDYIVPAFYTSFSVVSTGVCTGTSTTTPDPQDITAPTIPTLYQPSIEDGIINVNWTASTDSESELRYYKLYEKVGATAFALVYTGASLSFTRNPATNGTSYQYYITAEDYADNVSAASTTQSVTPEAPADVLQSVDLGNPYSTAQLAYDTATSYTTYYHDGPQTYPNTVDYVYTSSTGTTTLTGGGNWYKIENTDYVIQIDNNGFVFNRYDMSQTLSITPSSTTVSDTAGSFTATITSNTDWILSEGLSWVSITGASGVGNGTATVSYTANTGAQRSGTITVRTGDNAFQDTIILTQAAVAGTLYSHSLGYGLESTACSATQQTYYADSSNFATATALYTDSAGATFAGIGYYSDGESWRYWSARDNAFTADGFCSF